MVDVAAWRGVVATSVLLGLGGLAAGPATAQSGSVATDAQMRSYSIRAQALGTALQEFAAQAGLQLLFSQSDVAGMRTAGLQGTFTKDQALERLLAGSGLAFEFPTADAVIIRLASAARGANSGAPSPAAAESQSVADLQEIIVTGRAGVEQRTKEETSYSVTTIDQKKLRLQGPTSVTESLKSVPGFWVEASGGEASGNVRARNAGPTRPVPRLPERRPGFPAG
jgi:catecholate siderophore receptor